jgi:uncharacterized membrane protein YeaQ/YmgE (transglycosylase-associated protein family)
MSFETIAITALTGLLAGWLTGFVMRGGVYGTVGDIGLGVVGGVMGGVALWMQGLAAIDSRFALIAAAGVGGFVMVVLQRKFWNPTIAATR